LKRAVLVLGVLAGCLAALCFNGLRA